MITESKVVPTSTALLDEVAVFSFTLGVVLQSIFRVKLFCYLGNVWLLGE